MKLTVLFGTDAEFQRLDHHQLIRDWAVISMTFTDKLTLKFVRSIYNLAPAGEHSVIRTIDPSLTFETIAAIHHELPTVQFVPVQTMLKPVRLPVLPFMPRGLGKSWMTHLQLRDIETPKLDKLPNQFWVDEADILSPAQILSTFRSGLKFVDEQLLDGKFTSVADDIRQRQIKLVMEFEAARPGVPWKIVTSPGSDSFNVELNEYRFSVVPMYNYHEKNSTINEEFAKPQLGIMAATAPISGFKPSDAKVEITFADGTKLPVTNVHVADDVFFVKPDNDLPK